MADDSFKGIVTSLVIISLFALLVFGFVISMGTKYGLDSDVANITDRFNVESINSTVQSIDENAQNWKQAFEGQSVWTSIGILVAEGVFSLAKTITSFILLPFQIITSLLAELGIPTIVISIIYALLLISIIFAIYRWMKTAN